MSVDLIEQFANACFIAAATDLTINLFIAGAGPNLIGVRLDISVLRVLFQSLHHSPASVTQLDCTNRFLQQVTGQITKTATRR